jgi:hypothetical protein
VRGEETAERPTLIERRYRGAGGEADGVRQRSLDKLGMTASGRKAAGARRQSHA